MAEKMDKESHLQISITKALSPSEAPLKSKHARSVIIATHRSKSAKPFWTIITKQPIMEHRFTAWKFCHLLHKVLREGHESTVKQSQTHKTLILEVGKLWGHLQDGVGKCIEAYTKLLVNKLEFHQKNGNIPGSLTIDFKDFVRNVGDDLNLCFQLCVEVFDYIEHIIQVQAQIFLAITTYRLSSMTAQGQCRLAPLLTLIQDSNPLYDLCVRIMFRLHDGLSHDVLMGHRKRFNEIFNKLKFFYENVRPLQYFSDVIQLPHLPETTPNFSSELDLGNYKAPVMVLSQEPESEPEPVIDNLVDIANAMYINDEAKNALEEKETIIKNLTDDLNEKQMELEHFKSMTNQIEKYQSENEFLEKEVERTKRLVHSAKLENARHYMKFGELCIKVNELEQEKKQLIDKMKQTEEKFEKIKTMYSKMRIEHINLLRMRNEHKKELENEREEVQELREQIKNLSEEMEQSPNAEKLNSKLESKLIKYEEILAEKGSYIENLEYEIANLKEELQKQQEEELHLLEQLGEQKGKLETDYKLLITATEDKQHLENEIRDLKDKLEQQVSKTDEIDTSLKLKSQEYEKIIANKDLNIRELNSELSHAKELLLQSNLKHTTLIKQYEDQIKTRQEDSDLFKANAKRELEAKQQRIDELLSIESYNKAALQEFERKLNSVNIENQNKALELTTVQKQVESLEKSQTEIYSSIDNIISSIIAAVNHSLETDFVYKVFDANLLLQQVKTNTNTVREHLKSILEAYKLKVGSNTRLTGDFAKSCIYLISSLRTLHDYISLVAENTTDMENVHALRTLSDSLRHSLLIIYKLIMDNSKDIGEVERRYQTTVEKLSELIDLLLLMSNSFTENLNIGDLLQKELRDMDKMIDEAAQKMLEIQQSSKSKDEGIKLEVNEKILDSCTNLMQCIIHLIKKSRDLQNEIVARGKGTFTEKEFYKRNSQWTEGLISASKNVAKGANYLVDAANKAIVLESNECFEIIVAAQEIAASTAQLVIASKVKASKDSQKLMDLTKASRDVSLATGSVVATVKDGCNKLEYKNEIDMTKLTTSQKKAMEMEMHIKVLQLEQALDNERQNLMSFRKKFYQSEDD